MSATIEITAAQLAEQLGAVLHGDGTIVLRAMAPLVSAGSDQLAFLANPKYLNQLEGSQAGAVICHESVREHVRGVAVVHGNPYLAYAHASQLFAVSSGRDAGVAASAYVHPTAKLGEGVSVGPGAVIEADAVIGAGTVIGPNCVVGHASRLGAHCILHANVVLYHHVQLGDRVELHSGVVLGADGFGFAPSPDGWVKIAQLGTVVIGDDVNIGAGTTIDRGALDDTVIEAGVILDNQIQIGHNVRIGQGTAIAGCTGVAGSAAIGRQCLIGGQCGIAGHIEICDNVQITTNTLVTRSITESGSYSGATAMSTTQEWRRNAARGRQLYQWTQRIQALEKRLPLDSDGDGVEQQ